MSNPPRAFVGASPRRVAGIAFRPAEDGDFVFMRDLYADVRAAELAPVPWPEAAKRDFLAQQFDLQHAHYANAYRGGDFLIVLHDGERIGRLYVYRAAQEIRIVDIALVPVWRGRGIGAALFAELMDEARITRSTITLHVEPNNPAQHLYARLGFRLVENRGVYEFLQWSPN